MKKNFAFFLIFYHVLSVNAVVLAQNITFAGMQLRCSAGAIAIIQGEVDVLKKNAVYFKQLVDKANLYFPLIEPILRQYNIPEDLKYLAIQESALKADVVSKSEAVGFWQFKDYTAQEVGLIINENIDQRMDILSSTQGMAKYLNISQNKFNNWCYSVISYMTGRSGAADYIEKKYIGKKKMKITPKTHWYLLRLLSYKMAFESILGKESHPKYFLQIYHNHKLQTLQNIANHCKIDYLLLKDYNKWLKNEDFKLAKNMYVVLPMLHQKKIESKKEKIHVPIGVVAICKKNESAVWIHDLPAIISRKYDSIPLLAEIGKISLEDFILFNEIDITHHVNPGQIYYFSPKKDNIKQYIPIENCTKKDLWTLSQQYGVKVSCLKAKIKKTDL